MFNPSRLRLARKRRGYTATHVASECDLTPQSISAYERGKTEPTSETLATLARFLRFPVAFFGQDDLDEPSPEGVSFRGLAAMTARQRDMALACGATTIALSTWLEERFHLPECDLPSLRGFEPEAAAEALRAHWGLGTEPCPNAIQLLESKGVRVFSLPRDSASVHAFSFFHEERPFILLTTDTSGEKGRFDALHEIGHLCLHRHASPAGRQAELEADRFASSFLMPRSTVIAAVPQDADLRTLIRLKKTWKVSLAALVHRAHQVGRLSEWRYRSLCIELSRRGFRKKEPNGMRRERSRVHDKALASLKKDGIGRREIANELMIPTADLDGITFVNLRVSSAGNGASKKPTSPKEDRRPRLRVV